MNRKKAIGIENKTRKYKARKGVEYKEKQDVLKVISVPQYSKETLLLVARDRGYQSEESVIYAMSRMLECSNNKARAMLNTGRMTWGEVLVIGAMWEMTPREFCDTFLHGYFEEVSPDVYRATVERPGELVLAPIEEPPKPKAPKPEDGWTLFAEKRPQKGKDVLITTDRGDVKVGSWDFIVGMPISHVKWLDPNGKLIMSDVIAWQPMPKPCKRKPNVNEDAK